MIPHFSRIGIHHFISIALIILTFVTGGCAGSAPKQAQLPLDQPQGATTEAAALPPDQTDQMAPPVEDTPDEEMPEATQDVEVDEASLRGITVNFWHTWPEEQILPLVEEFNRTNTWGITVAPWYQSNSARLSENVRRAMLENDAPQVALGYTDQAVLWDKVGNLANLDDFIKSSQWGIEEEEQQDFHEVFWKYGLVDGKRLGIPALASGVFLFYNQSWAYDLGFSNPPADIQSFKEQACAANAAMKTDTKPENDSTGGWMVNTDPATILSWLYAFGSEVISESDKDIHNSVYRFDSENAQDSFFYLRDLYDKKCVWVSTEGYPDEEFVDRRALFVTGGPVDLPYQTIAFTEGGSSDQWTIIPFPSSANDPVVITQVPSFSIIRSTPEEDMAAWLFARWMTSPSIQAKWSALTGYFPVRSSVNDLMGEYAGSHPQWSMARDLIKYARTEPVLPSWGDIRWVVGDAGIQIFRPYFTADRIPLTLKELDSTAQEISDMNG